jgi:hypothetical protein
MARPFCHESAFRVEPRRPGRVNELLPGIGGVAAMSVTAPLEDALGRSAPVAFEKRRSVV